MRYSFTISSASLTRRAPWGTPFLALVGTYFFSKKSLGFFFFFFSKCFQWPSSWLLSSPTTVEPSTWLSWSLISTRTLSLMVEGWRLASTKSCLPKDSPTPSSRHRPFNSSSLSFLVTIHPSKGEAITTIWLSSFFDPSKIFLPD